MPDFSNFLEIQTKTAWGRTLAEFASFCDPRPASRILDIGCGPGLLPVIFSQSGHKAFGADIDFDLLSSSLSQGLLLADAIHLPFQTSSFDLITASNVLFLLDDPLTALRTWTRLLAPGGEICLLNPSENLSISSATELADSRGLDGTARESLLGWAHNAETHFRWTETETGELMSTAGLKLQKTEPRVGPNFARFTRAKLH